MIGSLKLNKITNINISSFILYFLPISLIVGNSAINILNFILVILFFLVVFNEKIFLKKYIKLLKILLLISLIFFLNIIFSIDKIGSFVSYLGFLGDFILMLMIIYCLDLNNNFAKNFFKIIFFATIFVSADTLYQYFVGKDIFGYTVDNSHGRRLSGPFGDEYVVGSYLSKFFFLGLLFFRENKFKYLKLLLIFSCLVIIILSNERAASIMFCFATFLYLIFNNEFSSKEKILKFFIFIVILISLFKFISPLRHHFIDRTFEQVGITQTEKNPHYNFFDSQWGAHFLTSFEIFKNYKITGSGLETFRIECANENYSKVNSVEVNKRCSTHPHNIYLEVLSETGLIGFAIFTLFILSFAYKILRNFLKSFKFSNQELLIGLSFFILFNPFQTTGAFFSTWNGSFYWILIPFILRIDKIRLN